MNRLRDPCSKARLQACPENDAMCRLLAANNDKTLQSTPLRRSEFEGKPASLLLGTAVPWAEVLTRVKNVLYDAHETRSFGDVCSMSGLRSINSKVTSVKDVFIRRRSARHSDCKYTSSSISVQRFGAIVTTPWIAPSLRADMIFREGQGLQMRRLTRLAPI